MLAGSYLAYVVLFAVIVLPFSLGISKVPVTEDPTLWYSITHFWGLYLFYFLGKLFIALVVMYGWALAIYCNSFREACWLFMFLGIAFGVGLAIGMGIYIAAYGSCAYARDVGSSCLGCDDSMRISRNLVGDASCSGI